VTADPDAEVRARVAWNLVAEPGDPTAGAVVAALGPAPALAWARWAVGVPAVDALDRLRALTRAADVDPTPPRAVPAAAPTVGPSVGPSVGPAAARPSTARPSTTHPSTARPSARPAAGTGTGPVPVQDGLWPARWPDGIARVLARAVPRWAPRIAHLDPERALAELVRVGGTLLVPGRPGWPRRLDDLGVQAPLCLWVRGDPRFDVVTERSVAVVGARASTAYGERVAADLGSGLADRGVTVVSGGAFGIDVAAHRGALAAGGVTLALLAGGIDRPSPAGNLDLLERLADGGGALVAECPPGTVPSRARFLQRNRLIAAVAGATVVVEAAWRSGALSTAARAAELLRPLGAVPGPVTSMASAGCHRLLRDGAAVCVTDAAEVVELLGPPDGDRAGPAGPAAERTPPRTAHPADPTDRADSLASRVLDALPARRGIGVEAVARRAGLSEREAGAQLGLLELAGSARRVEGRWSVAPPRARPR
jgi:DNA processing protein